jgi:hypothetical protein
MPDDPDILGFSNRWYARGIETSVDHALTEDMTIRLLSPEYFVATKLEAHLGRGGGDLFTSRDMEDILLIVDGRPAIVDEILGADGEVRDFIAEQFAALLADGDFEYFLEGNVRGPAGRSDIVRDRFIAVSGGI